MPSADLAATIEKRRAAAFRYLLDYIRDKGITSPDPWVDRDTFERVAESAKETGSPTR